MSDAEQQELDDMRQESRRLSAPLQEAVLLHIDNGLNYGYSTNDIAAHVVHRYALLKVPGYLDRVQKARGPDRSAWTPEIVKAAYDDMQNRSASFGAASEDELLAAVGGDLGPEDGYRTAFEEASEESWSDAAARGTANEWASERANAPSVARDRSISQTQIEREADDLISSINALEKRMRTQRATPQQIAAAIEGQYGFEVRPDDIAKGNVWWRVGEMMEVEQGRGVRRSPERIAELASLWMKTDLSRSKIASTLTDLWGIPIDENWVHNALQANGMFKTAEHRLAGIDPEKRWTPDRVRELTRLHDGMASDPSISIASITQLLNAMPGPKVSERLVSSQIETLGLRKKPGRQSNTKTNRPSVVTPEIVERIKRGEFGERKLPEIAELLSRELGRPVNKNMIVSQMKRLRDKAGRQEVAKARGDSVPWQSAVDTYLLSPRAWGKSINEIVADISKLPEMKGESIGVSTIYLHRGKLSEQGYVLPPIGRPKRLPRVSPQLGAILGIEADARIFVDYAGIYEKRERRAITNSMQMDPEFETPQKTAETINDILSTATHALKYKVGESWNLIKPLTGGRYGLVSIDVKPDEQGRYQVRTAYVMQRGEYYRAMMGTLKRNGVAGVRYEKTPKAAATVLADLSQESLRDRGQPDYAELEALRQALKSVSNAPNTPRSDRPALWTTSMVEALKGEDVAGLKDSDAAAELNRRFGTSLNHTSVNAARLKYGLQWRIRKGRPPSWTDDMKSLLDRDDVKTLPAWNAAKVINGAFGTSLTVDAVNSMRRQLRQVKQQRLKDGLDKRLNRSSDEPMFAAGGWFKPDRWRETWEGLKNGRDRTDVGQSVPVGREDGGEGGRSAQGQSGARQAADAGSGVGAAGRRDGSARVFSLRGYVGRSIDAIPTAAGLGQRFVFLHPEKAKVLEGEGRGPKATVARLRAVPNWVARAHVVEIAPGVWTVDDIKVRSAKRMRGLGNELLTEIEQQLGTDLTAPRVMTPDLFRVWQKRDPDAVADYARFRGELHSRDRLESLRAANAAIADADESDTRSRNAARKDMAEIDAVLAEMAKTDDVDAAFGTMSADDVIRKQARAALRMGKTFTVPERTVEAVHAALAPDMVAVPSDVNVGTLARIEPAKDEPGVPMARFIFTTATGDEIRLTGSVDRLLRIRAAYIPATDTRAGGIVFFRLTAGDLSSNSLRGELIHEVSHALRRQRIIDDNAWGRLLAHATSLGILDYDHRKFLIGVNDRSYRETMPGRKIREVYGMDYAGRSDYYDAIDQEAVAHFIELVVHNQLPKMDVDPVRDILDDIISGRKYGRAQEAASSRRAQTSRSRGQSAQMEMDLALEGDLPVAPGLDMSPEARKQRADEQGFDTGRVFYRGGDGDYRSDSTDAPSTYENDAGVIFFTSRPDEAGDIALNGTGFGQKRSSPSVVPAYIKRENFHIETVDGVDPTTYFDENSYKLDERLIDAQTASKIRPRHQRQSETTCRRNESR